MLFVAIALFELANFLLQLSPIVSSYDHPTISTVLDPVLATHQGRSVALLVWLVTGVSRVGLSWHDITIVLYLILLGLGGVLEVAALRSDSRLATFGTVVRRLRSTHTGRVGLAAGWLWIGLHFFAR